MKSGINNFTDQIYLFKGNEGGSSVPYLDVGDAATRKTKPKTADDPTLPIFEAVYGATERSETAEYGECAAELMFSSVDYHRAFDAKKRRTEVYDK